MPLINIQDACLSFSNLEILRNAMLRINKNERVCLIGRNGAGKSTLLKIINKTQDLDHGHIIYKKNINVSYLTQENPKKIDISIYDFLSSGLQEIHITQKKNNNNNNLKNMSLLDARIISTHDIVKIEKIIDIININKNTLLSSLSGGLLRKAALAQVLIAEPDVLLLDEPTNHLDMTTVKWLEVYLKKFYGSILFVSHDRSFIQNISTRIVDLDRGKLISWPGDYKNFTKLKNESIRIEKIQKKLFDQNLEKEEKWIKKGVKARTTRNEGRVKNLKKLRKQYDNYQKIEQLTDIKINQTKNHSSKIIFKINNINFFIHNKIIVKNFSSIIQNGDKIGLIGDNGCGKSTIIQIIMGEKKPHTGKIYTGKGLKIAYFDQNRSILDPNKSIIENIEYGKEKVTVNGKEQHLVGYLKNFLFKSNQIKSLVKTLSGGECNRLLLARLFLKPSNVLILDEPTNDLDLNTLELLEKIIIDYKGTVILVSHDKEFIKNTVNKYWIFKENGLINTYIGSNAFIQTEKKSLKKEKKIHTLFTQKKKKAQSNFKEKLNKTLYTIEQIEKHITQLQDQMNQKNFFKQELVKRLPVLKLLTQKEKELEEQLVYWEKLEQDQNHKM